MLKKVIGCKGLKNFQFTKCFLNTYFFQSQIFSNILLVLKPNLLKKDSNTVALLHIRAYACACRLVTCSVLGSGAVHRGIPPTTSQSFTAPPAPPPAPGATPTAPLRPRRRDFAAQFAGQKMWLSGCTVTLIRGCDGGRGWAVITEFVISRWWRSCESRPPILEDRQSCLV